MMDWLTMFLKHLFDNGRPVALTNKQGDHLSTKTNDSWDIKSATKEDDGFIVLLEGTGDREGSSKTFTTNSRGVVKKSSAWTSDMAAATQRQLDVETNTQTDLFSDGGQQKDPLTGRTGNETWNGLGGDDRLNAGMADEILAGGEYKQHLGSGLG